MTQIDRRNLLRSMTAAAIGLPIAMRSGVSQAYGSPPNLSGLIADQAQREAIWDLIRPIYFNKDQCNATAFLAAFSQASQVVYQDATAGVSFPTYGAISGAFEGILGGVQAVVGAGNFCKLFHVTGDPNYGAVAEFVDLRNVFYASNGMTVQAVIDLDTQLIARETDYWDTRELGYTDIYGPAVTAGVAIPFGATAPGGVPRQLSTAAPPGPVSLSTGVTGKPSCSPQMLQFALQFQAALACGNVSEVMSLFTSDALYISPAIHQGPVQYGNFNDTIQIRGQAMIQQLFSSVIQSLPDCLGSSLVHVVGGTSGGGFEWKAGGQYSGTGLNRNGLNGCTSIDLVGGQISRMSVKFDTFQLTTSQYTSLQSQIAHSGVLD